MKIIFIFACSGMFRDVPECSGMFRHVPECSMFRILSTASKLLLENTTRARKVNKTKEHSASIDGYKHNIVSVSYTHLRAHETDSYLVCRLLLEKNENNFHEKNIIK